MGSVPGLIVILNKVDKELRWLNGAGDAARLPGLWRDLPLIDKSFRQRPSDILCRLMRKILIIRMGFTGRENVRGIMEVIIPFSGKQRCAGGGKSRYGYLPSSGEYGGRV